MSGGFENFKLTRYCARNKSAGTVGVARVKDDMFFQTLEGE